MEEQKDRETEKEKGRNRKEGLREEGREKSMVEREGGGKYLWKELHFILHCCCKS